MRAERKYPRCSSILLAIFTMAAMAAFAGCSVRQNYKTLSFFFDGVPDPNAPVQLNRTINPLDPTSPTLVVAKMYRHKPYAEQKCTECHTADKKHLIMLKADLCLKCHQDKTHQYAVM